MEVKKYGHYLILWSAIDHDGEEEKVAAYFKGPYLTADFALENSTWECV